ncbi:hypothetical protein [Haloechinothrix salitolerans]|uniref:Holin n=1 Tax=Haloechinothrix salitolerans TaxID=926830 RepID=A0ABW2BTV3_9PSEU
MNTESEDRTDTARSGPLNRVASALAWYTPELTGAAVSAGAAATVWAPLGAISAALGAWIATDQVNAARARRHARREVEYRAQRAQLDPAEDHDGEDDGAQDDARADDGVSVSGPAADERAERPGWEVAG